LTLYVRYADSLPSDSLAPEYLFKAADISMYQSDDKRTITLLDRVITEYADYEKASTCLFLKAFVYDTKVGDTAMAHKFYNEFIQQYPDNDFTVDARSAIRNLGKPLDELIKEFELQNQ
ncbi:MAG: hypothetical protein Q8T08_05195, partial [Ignavibacteria bacterium]|nr:hypothetical protein [Ignavibacteria bacterium]